MLFALFLALVSISSANRTELRAVFDKYAHHVYQNENYMTPHEFVQDYLCYLKGDNIETKTLDILSSLVDLNKDQRITFTEFQQFESLLLASDSLYRLAFQLFDKTGHGLITFESFQDIITSTSFYKKFPFNFDSEFITLHFGAKRQRQINYKDFTQILLDFIDEQTIQAFKTMDNSNQGYITLKNFDYILKELRQYQLSDFITGNLYEIIKLTKYNLDNSTHITFPYFMAFLQLLNNIELMKKIYLQACLKHPAHFKQQICVSKQEFLNEAQHFPRTTPLQCDILFAIIHLLHQQGIGRGIDTDQDKVGLLLRDFDLIGQHEHQMPYRIKTQIIDEQYNIERQGIGMKVLESGYRFALGSIAGAVGATAVYPIDLVKTRMQNQRSGSIVGERMYRSSLDCFQKVVRHEGVFGLYRGLVPQLVGVAPEKAIKLTMNDFIRDRLTLKDGTIPLWCEVVAGGCAGASQVTFTNPLEIVKIRLQVAGEIQTAPRPSAIQVVRELGFLGLYKGAKACFLRDIPFSAIYFPAYAHTKKKMANEQGYNDPKSLFISGLLAGIPAAGLCTPADVIKTRLQVVARKGQTAYLGLTDAAIKIFREEGWTAFWKGAGARMFRSSPQFGFTLLTYELLQRFLNVDFHGRKLQGSHTEVGGKDQQHTISRNILSSTNPDHIGGFHLALATFEGIETRFGLAFPKYKSTTNEPSNIIQTQTTKLTTLLGIPATTTTSTLLPKDNK
ncbi:unnamed protein product [Didymodactylos carnosus]|uniref:EF-hand domain-containing protein n=1 Tax=Didymodactylos carnosus TaxID=1234261 RepID=A0A814MYT3_9BILA|nr:unnamed protein product [Didymodactylos carnosus]CAF1360063.1 unnamed protein product [Didymodactylos carnosus]CAF3850736.1 unnamed protein product [Didymodactylos carnosus]CAF4170296.1 unnamed protein product [Didymodactylos carnosus]